MINSSDVNVLSVGPVDEHQKALADIVRRNPTGRLACCLGVEAALPALRSSRVPVVLCDSQLNWRQLLDQLRGLPEPPFLIVTSRLADDRLWSEALNLGAYDVLAKPFDSNEVTRVLAMAWMRWSERSTSSFRPACRQQVMLPAYA